MTISKTKTASTKENYIAHPENFELAYAELESIVARMESGQMTLESSLEAYQRGNGLLQFCQKSLADVEQQVQILNERNQLMPFKPDDE
jgi:exodeoxyribonuclease VII small subunit